MTLTLNTGKFEQYVIKRRDTYNGVQYIFRMPNDYGASVVKHNGSYGHANDLWELAVLHFNGSNSNWDITYDTPITYDVLGWLSDEEVIETLDKILHLGENDGATSERDEAPQPATPSPLPTLDYGKVSELTKFRADQLEAMHKVICLANDEDIYLTWILLVPDEPSREDFEDMAEDPATYNEVCDLVQRLVSKPGFSASPAGAT